VSARHVTVLGAWTALGGASAAEGKLPEQGLLFLLLLANNLYPDYNTYCDWFPALFAWIKYTPG
jgi:hypothetical protein